MTKRTAEVDVTATLPSRKHQAQPYGDLVQLNTKRLIVDSVRADVLTDIIDADVDLLESSAAIYELNGDYAAGILSSGWCRFLDATSRSLCETDDNKEAIESGQWRCHESCWETSKASIDKGEPVDLPCLGGIRILAVPIRAGGEIIGSINFGYGDPPQDPEKLQEIADRYNVSVNELREKAEAHKPRSPKILKIAKSRLQTSAKLIGTLVETKRTEDALQASEAKFHDFYDNAPDMAVSVCAKTALILECNRTVAEALGYKKEELIGRSVFDVYHPDCRKDLKEAFQSFVETGEVHDVELQLKRKDGSKIDVDLNVNAIRDAQGNILRSRSFWRDITERKRAEKALRDSEAKARAVLEHAIDAIVSIDDKSLIRSFNPAAEKMFGYTEDEVIGENVKRLMPEPYRSEHEGYVQTYLATGEKNVIGNVREVVGRRKDGTTFPIDITVGEVRLQDGRRFVGSMRDITERKQAEKATHAAQQELIRRHRKEKQIVDKELEKVKAELVRSTRLAAIGQVAAQIAHDLRNPLGSVRNAAFYLKEIVTDSTHESADELVEFLSLIDDEVNTCDEIIGNLLEATRPKKAIRETVDLGRLVEAELSRLRFPKDVRPRFKSAPNPFLVQVDSVQWRQVVDNLLKNSLDAVGDRGEVEFRAVRGDEFDEMTIRDSGPGISSEHRQSIFDMLFTTKAKGTGLGLAICRQIVERHGGTIELAPQQDQGATFVIRLPRKPSM